MTRDNNEVLGLAKAALRETDEEIARKKDELAKLVAERADFAVELRNVGESTNPTR